MKIAPLSDSKSPENTDRLWLKSLTKARRGSQITPKHGTIATRNEATKRKKFMMTVFCNQTTRQLKWRLYFSDASRTLKNQSIGKQKSKQASKL